jgi:tetratricopeptide (TPR) repeat protein
MQTVRRPTQSAPWWATQVDLESPSSAGGGVADSLAASRLDSSTHDAVDDISRADSLAVAPDSETSTSLPMAGPRIYGIGPIEQSEEHDHPDVVELSDAQRRQMRDSAARRSGEERDRVEQVNAYALWCVESERWAEARTHLEQAVARDSLASSLHNNLGILYERLGEPVKARAAYERALVLQPGKGAYQSNLRRLDGADVSHSEDDKEHLRRRSDYDQSGDQTDDLFRMVHD